MNNIYSKKKFTHRTREAKINLDQEFLINYLLFIKFLFLNKRKLERDAMII